MSESAIHNPPIRIDDIIALKQRGHEVTCNTEFEINEVDFTHRDNEFRAVLFFCCFVGTVDGNEYRFRKCYARGCPNNLCPHVSQAVMIANRYLLRDYRRLGDAGIRVEPVLFSMDEMLMKFPEGEHERTPTLTVDDFVNIAREGTEVSINVNLEYLPAVENFQNHKEKRTFLLAGFSIDSLGSVHQCQRCFSCYATLNESEELPRQARIANDRLRKLYKEFDQAGVRYEPRYFG